MIAFAAVGFGLAVVFPCLFSLAAKLVPNGKAAAMGYVGMVGGLPRITLPFLMGWLAQTYSLGAVFAAAAVVNAGDDNHCCHFFESQHCGRHVKTRHSNHGRNDG